MIEEVRPNKAEVAFLDLAYNKFYDIYDEVMDDSFWDKDVEDSMFYLKDILSEKEGVKFSFILMRKIVDTQIEMEELKWFYV